MGITHVIRGSEYLSSTPKYNLLYEAFGWPVPCYIHCPPVMKDAQHKLSKRNGDASYQDLVAKGYLPAAVLNYLLLLGWAPEGEQEIFSLEEMVKIWDPTRISKSPAIFDPLKLRAINAAYLRALPAGEFRRLADPFLDTAVHRPIDRDLLCANLQPRCEVLEDIPPQLDFIDRVLPFDAELYRNKKQKTTPESAKEALEALLPLMEAQQDWNRDAIFEACRQKAAELGQKNGWLLYPLVLARLVQCHLLGREPFERLWMLRYIDQQLVADSRRTRELLDWKPTPRKTITRRLVFLIENMQRNPELWRSWNAAMLHRTANRPQLILHERLCAAMDSERDEVVRPVVRALLAAAEGTIPGAGPAPGALDSQVLASYVRLLCQLIITVLRTRNRPMMQQYAHTITFLPLNAGLSNGLASHTLFLLGEQLIDRFRSRAEFQRLASGADEYLSMTIHMAVDQIEDRLELARLQSPALREELRRMPPPKHNTRLDKVVNQLEDLCREAISGQSWTSPPVDD